MEAEILNVLESIGTCLAGIGLILIGIFFMIGLKK